MLEIKSLLKPLCTFTRDFIDVLKSLVWRTELSSCVASVLFLPRVMVDQQLQCGINQEQLAVLLFPPSHNNIVVPGMKTSEYSNT